MPTPTNPATSSNSVTIPTELPTSGTDNDVLTWDATSNSWVAHNNDGVDDGDARVTNELSDLSINGNTLT